MSNKNLHRMVVEMDKATYIKLRGYLLTNESTTVSAWIRALIAAKLAESK